MKKTLLLLASAAMLLVGCAKEKLGPDAGSGEMVTANFTAQMQGMPQTKSVTDGEGTKANRCVMEIYYKGVLYTRDVQPISSMKATFTPRLVSNRTYDVLFWADCGKGLADKYYKTNAEGLGLRAVEMMDTTYVANDDARDAFYTTESVPVGQQVSSETFTLTRPFSQVNIITTDAAIIKNANLYPDGVKMVYKAPTKFNLLTGELSKEKALTVTGIPYEAFNASSAALTLEMDYLFTSKDKSALDIAFEASKTGESTVTSHSFTNIPVQRNYRTNIKGALLTTTGDWTATIVPGWNQPDEEVKYVEAGSVAAANEAFANGATSVKITSVGEETTLYLPVLTDEVTIDFANPSKGITVQYGPAPTKAAGDKPAAVNIATNDVTKFTVSGISNIVWLAGNQAALANALNNAVAGQTVALANDITMSETWTPCELNADFNGNGHTIKGMKNTSCAPDYAGLFYVSYSNIKNVTIQDAEFAYGTETMAARGGVLVGDMRRGSIENCHVVGAEFTGYQKVGGLVGFISANADDHTDISIKNCSVKNATFAACGAHDPNDDDDDYLYQAGGLVGYIALGNRNISISNCSVENIIYDNSKYSGVYDKPNTNNGYLSHTFVGAIFSQTNNAANTLAFTANTISGEKNTQLNANMYGSAYFGWARNPEYKPSETVTLGRIIIDGQEWTPNYPFKNVTTGKGYATLDAALAALQQGETLEIWEAGEYTVQTLSTPANTTIDAKVDGVVFNHTAAASSWIASDAISGRTVKNITWNIGNADYQALHVANLVGCTINGRFYPHGGPVTFTDCVFNAPGYEYCLWTWNNDATFKSCTFNTHGKAVNVYGSSTNTYIFEDCVFNATNIPEDKGKAAIFVKDGVDTDNDNAKVSVSIKNCTANYERPYNQLDKDDVQYSESVLWNVEIGSYSSTNEVSISIDGEKVYPFTNFKVSDAAGLRRAVEMFNNSKQAVEHTIIVNDGTYEVSDMAIAENVNGKTVIIKAANEGQVTLKMNADTKSKQIFLVDGYSGNYSSYRLVIDGFKFDLTAVTSGTAAPVYAFQAGDGLASTIGYTTKGPNLRYAHHITIQNCELVGAQGKENAMMFNAGNNTSPNNIVVKDSKVVNAGYLFSGYCNTITATNVTATNVKHFVNNQGSGITVENCTVDCYTDYAIRANAGPVSITGSTFVMTYTGSDKGGIYVDRGNGTQLTMTGNTYPASYAGANMHDVYNENNGNCILNGSITLQNEEYYDFPRN